MDILQELWEARHPYDTMFLEFIKDIEIVKQNNNHFICYKIKEVRIFDYNKDTCNVFYWYAMSNIFKNIEKKELENLIRDLIQKYFSLEIRKINMLKMF